MKFVFFLWFLVKIRIFCDFFYKLLSKSTFFVCDYVTVFVCFFTLLALLTKFAVFLIIFQQNSCFFCYLLITFYSFLAKFTFCLWSFDELCTFFTIFWRNSCVYCELLMKFTCFLQAFDEICVSCFIFAKFMYLYNLWSKFACFSRYLGKIHMFFAIFRLNVCVCGFFLKNFSQNLHFFVCCHMIAFAHFFTLLTLFWQNSPFCHNLLKKLECFLRSFDEISEFFAILWQNLLSFMDVLMKFTFFSL